MLAQFSSLFRGFVALSAGAEEVSMGEWDSCLPHSILQLAQLRGTEHMADDSLHFLWYSPQA